MRLWTLHPKYLDARGLVAAWREALLAQAVLRGRTSGYRRHPQLARFRECSSPVGAIGCYLVGLYREATRRGYHFDRRRIAQPASRARLRAPVGQIEYEWRHLKRKLAARDRAWLAQLPNIRRPEAHPAFHIVAGGVATWEKEKPEREVEQPWAFSGRTNRKPSK